MMIKILINKNPLRDIALSISKPLIFLLICFYSSTSVFGQIGINTPDPDPSSILDVNSETKGLLIPSMASNNRLSIINPADGLLVYDIDLKSFFFYDQSKNAWMSINPWIYQSPEFNGTTYDMYTLLNTNVGIGRLGPEEKLHVAGSVKIDEDLYVEGNIDVTGNISANTVASSTFSGNGAGITHVNAARLGNNLPNYYGTAADVSALEENKADKADLYTEKLPVDVSSTAYCWSTNTVFSSDVSYSQVGNMVFVTGQIYFDVEHEYHTICARFSNLPTFPPGYGKNAAGAQIAFYNSGFDNYGGSIQFQSTDSGYGNIIQFHRVEKKNFVKGRWRTTFQFFYYAE